MKMMEMATSFDNQPGHYKIAYSLLGVILPVILLFVVVIAWGSGIRDFDCYIFPVVFGIVMPAVILKDMIFEERFWVEDFRLRLKKKGKDDTIHMQHLAAVMGMRDGNRFIIFFAHKDRSTFIAVGDGFPMDRKEALFSWLKACQPLYGYDVKETMSTGEAMVAFSSYMGSS